MKALLLKDCYTLFKQSRIFILLILVFAVVPDQSMLGFAVVYAAMLPITALAYDERAKWDTLAAMMPYTSGALVFSKYLLGYVGIVLAGALAYVSKLALAVINGTVMEPELGVTILLLVCVAALMLALNLPFMFKLGVEKGRIVFLSLLAAAAVGVGAFGRRLIDSLSDASVDLTLLLSLVVLVTVVFNVLSVLCSARFYRRKSA